MSEDRHGYTVRIPQNLSAPDKILFGATARQAIILGGTAAGLWLTWLAMQSFVPPLLFAVPAGLLLLLLGIAVTGERDGVNLDRLLAAALRQALTPRRRVMAPEGLCAPPAFLNEALHGQNLPSVTPLGLPVQGVRDDGAVDLGADGAAVLATCSTVNFTLRTPAEQELLVGGFARWLNSLTGPVQITSRTTCADLNEQISALRTSAPASPHPLLEAAAQDHADFLVSLILDEAHNFLAMPIPMEDMLAEARAYRLALVLAHQNLAQMPPDLREGISANTRNKVFFTCSPEDAKALNTHVSPQLSEHDLAHLVGFQAAVRLSVDGVAVPAFTMRTRPLPPPIPGRAERIRELSAATTAARHELVGAAEGGSRNSRQAA